MNTGQDTKALNLASVAIVELSDKIAELEEQEEKNERTIKNMGLAIALAQEWTQEKDAKIAELEKEHDILLKTILILTKEELKEKD